MIRKAAQLLMVAGITMFTPILMLAQDDSDEAELVRLMIEGGVFDDSFVWESIAAVIGLVIIIIAAMAFATIREKQKRDLLARFAEKEQAVPRELLSPTPSPQREMRRGVWLLSLAAGLALVLYIATGDWEVAAWSLILVFLGVASFINAAFFYPKSNSNL